MILSYYEYDSTKTHLELFKIRQKNTKPYKKAAKPPLVEVIDRK